MEVAPNECVICGKPVVKGHYSYLSGSKPLGAMACEGECTSEAIRRHQETGRVDKKNATSRRY